MKTLAIIHALAFLLMAFHVDAKEVKKEKSEEKEDKVNCDNYYNLNAKDLDKIDKVYRDIQKIKPWIQYHYNGRSVSADKFNVIRQRILDPKQDPNMALP